jgi:uncharacterized membrane protein (DUF373 family)
VKLGGEDREPRGDHQDGRTREHEHHHAHGHHDAAHERHRDSAEPSQHREHSPAAKLHVAPGVRSSLARRSSSRDDAAEPEEVRGWIARAFTRTEDVVYVGLGVLLAASALILLVDGVVQFARLFGTLDRLQPGVIDLLDRILLILMIVEIMYTVQVSFREHALVPEPFLIVGLVAVIRRILVLTAEFGELMDKEPPAFANSMIELGLLSFMMLALVASLLLLKRRPVQAERA